MSCVLVGVSEALQSETTTDEVALWRARALRAEEQLADAPTRIDALTEQVATLSGMLFGQSSEQTGRRRRTPAAGDQAAGTPAGAGNGAQRRSRGQQPGSRGHGRRDYTHLETEEIVLEVPADQRCCASCGIEFEYVDAETADQIDWRVKITRIVYRRPRYRRRCGCAGPRSIIAPPAPNPVPKGHFTAGFLARLLLDKYVLSLPPHRIVRGLASDGLAVSEGTLCGAMKAT